MRGERPGDVDQESPADPPALPPAPRSRTGRQFYTSWSADECLVWTLDTDRTWLDPPRPYSPTALLAALKLEAAPALPDTTTREAIPA